MTTDQMVNILTIVTLFEMTIAMGLELKFTEVFEVAKDWRLILRAEFANFVLQPAAAMAVLLVVKPTPMAAAGIILLAACPAAHYAMPFTKFAKGKLAAAAGLLVVLAASTLIFAPIVIDVLLPRFSGGSAQVHVPTGKVITTLAFIILLPLVIGMSLQHWRPTLADRLQKPANRLSVLLNVTMLGCILLVQGHQLARIHPVGYVGIAVLAVASLVIGWLLGGPHSGNRKALAQNTLLRNMGPGLVIATAAPFAGTPAAPVIVAATLVNGLVGILAAYWWGSRPEMRNA